MVRRREAFQVEPFVVVCRGEVWGRDRGDVRGMEPAQVAHLGFVEQPQPQPRLGPFHFPVGLIVVSLHLVASRLRGPPR